MKGSNKGIRVCSAWRLSKRQLTSCGTQHFYFRLILMSQGWFESASLQTNTPILPFANNSGVAAKLLFCPRHLEKRLKLQGVNKSSGASCLFSWTKDIYTYFPNPSIGPCFTMLVNKSSHCITVLKAVLIMMNWVTLHKTHKMFIYKSNSTRVCICICSICCLYLTS